MLAAERATGRFVQVGYKKMFFPAIARAREIISRADEFGPPAQIYVRYPQALPPADARQPAERGMVSFLDHFFHPASIVHRLMGPVRRVSYVREALNGGSFSTLSFASGAAGVMHLAAGQSGTSPLERVEVVGKGANVVVENGVRLTYYRKGRRGEGGYGRASSFLGSDGEAPSSGSPSSRSASSTTRGSSPWATRRRCSTSASAPWTGSARPTPTWTTRWPCCAGTAPTGARKARPSR